MTSGTDKAGYIEVPFHCPLPAICPVCGSPAEKAKRLRAWEGIPLVFTYHLSVTIPYCRAHYEHLGKLEFRQRIAIWGGLVSPLAGMLTVLIDWSLQWPFKVGCLCLLAAIGIAFDYSTKLRASRGVQMRTLGDWPAYRLRSFRDDWNQALKASVEQFKKTQETNPQILRA